MYSGDDSSALCGFSVATSLRISTYSGDGSWALWVLLLQHAVFLMHRQWHFVFPVMCWHADTPPPIARG